MVQFGIGINTDRSLLRWQPAKAMICTPEQRSQPLEDMTVFFQQNDVFANVIFQLLLINQYAQRCPRWGRLVTINWRVCALQSNRNSTADACLTERWPVGSGLTCEDWL